MEAIVNGIGYIGTVAMLCMAGAIFRYWDGMDGDKNTGVFKVFQRTLARLAIAVIIAATATHLGIGWSEWPITAFLTTTIAVLTLHMGFTDWRNGPWQILRFGIPAIIIASLASMTGTAPEIAGLYVMACAAAGWAYSRIPENLARLPMGATLGLLALL